MATNTNDSSVYLYRLTFANTISAPKKDLPELVLDQGAKMEFKDSAREYYLTLGGVKINRKIYQPVEIEVELTLEQKSDNNTSTTPPGTIVQQCDGPVDEENGESGPYEDWTDVREQYGTRERVSPNTCLELLCV